MEKQIKQPLSPHLQIYKPQITSVMSIFHRITGLFLFFGIIAIIWMIFFFVYSDVYLDLTGFIPQILIKLFVFCMFFHSLNGIRYLFWSFQKGMELNAVSYTGFSIMILSFIFTFLIFILI